MKISERIEQLELLGGQENLRLLHLSDLHLWFSTRLLQQLSDIISRRDPELILMTGDYYDLPQGARNFRRFLLQITQRYPVVFIWGNHDHLYGPRITRLLSGIPNCSCVEQALYRYKSPRGFTYNISSWRSRQLLPGNPGEVNVALLHKPSEIDENQLSNLQLLLAGHLHGGQFILKKTKEPANFPGSLFYRHCSDRKLLGNTHLIVSRGLGDTLPLRFNCPREVVLLQIN